MGFRKKIRESLFGVPEKEPVRKSVTVTAKVKQSYGVRLSTDFKTQVKIFNEDPVIKESILQMAEQVASGGGFFVTGNEDYNGTLPVEGENMTALEYINWWNEKNSLDRVFLQASISLIAFGNYFSNITHGLKEIQIEAIDKAKSRTKLTAVEHEYDLVTTYEYGNKKLPHGSFLHFKTGTIGHAPFGSGIIIGLIAAPDDGTPSLYAVRKTFRKSMEKGFRVFSFGNIFMFMDGMTETQCAAFKTQLEGMNETGEYIVSNVPGNLQLSVPQRTQTYDAWIKQVDKEFYQALSSGVTPETEYTTKATAEAIRETFRYKIQSLRRVLKRTIEAHWRTVLEEVGFNGHKAGLRLHFGSEEVEYEVNDIFTAVGAGIINVEEARDLLREYIKWKIPKEMPIDDSEEPPITEEGEEE